MLTMKHTLTTKPKDTAAAVKQLLIALLPELRVCEDDLSLSFILLFCFGFFFLLTYSNCSTTVMIALPSSTLDTITIFSCYFDGLICVNW